jgi:hypothetical protein
VAIWDLRCGIEAVLISLREFARRNGVSHVAIRKAIQSGRLPSTDGKIDPDVAQPVWDRLRARRGGNPVTSAGNQNARLVTTRTGDPSPPQVSTVVTGPVTTRALKRLPIPVAINGAEYYDLLAGATAAGITIQAYVRTRCGLPPWISRGREMANRTQAARDLRALARLNITIMVTEEEHAALREQARAVGLSIPQYVRTRCGYSVRHSSQPGTEERVNEEDEAWDILRRLGMNADDYFDD